MTTENRNVALLASAARTATLNTADQQNDEMRGVHVIIDVSALSATPSVTPTIQGKDPTSGKYYSLLVGLPITATGTTVLKVHPSILPKHNAAAQDLLPAKWRVRLVHADSDSITYSVGANLMVT